MPLPILFKPAIKGQVGRDVPKEARWAGTSVALMNRISPITRLGKYLITQYPRRIYVTCSNCFFCDRFSSDGFGRRRIRWNVGRDRPYVARNFRSLGDHLFRGKPCHGPRNEEHYLVHSTALCIERACKPSLVCRPFLMRILMRMGNKE